MGPCSRLSVLRTVPRTQLGPHVQLRRRAVASQRLSLTEPLARPEVKDSTDAQALDRLGDRIGFETVSS